MNDANIPMQALVPPPPPVFLAPAAAPAPAPAPFVPPAAAAQQPAFSTPAVDPPFLIQLPADIQFRTPTPWES
jgi:hypothetical protein